MLYSLLQQSSGGNGAITGTTWLVWFVLFVLQVIALWKVFTKAGQPGWAAIIPIYNSLVMLRIVGRPWWWLLLFLVPFLNIVIYVILMLNLAKSYGRRVGFGIGLIIFPIIWLFILGFGSSKYLGPVAGPNAIVKPA